MSNQRSSDWHPGLIMGLGLAVNLFSAAVIVAFILVDEQDVSDAARAAGLGAGGIIGMIGVVITLIGVIAWGVKLGNEATRR